MGIGGSEEQGGSLAHIDHIAVTYAQTGGPVPKPAESLSSVWGIWPRLSSVRGKGGQVQSGDVLGRF